VKIPFSEIPSAGKRYTLSELSIPPSCEDFEVQGLFEFSCRLQKKKENQVLLQGKVRATLLLICDRCLGQYVYPVQTELQLILEVPTPENRQLQDIDMVVADLDVIELVDPVIDLEEIARQQLYVAIPVKQICLEGCKGICPECGQSLNNDTCCCTGVGKRNPFAVLAQLKKKQ